MGDVYAMKYGIGGACALLALMVVLKAGEFVLAFQRKKESLSEKTMQDLTKAVQENTAATQHLDRRLEKIEGMASDLPKLKNDVRRFYAAIKEVAGDKWPRVRDEIMKDEFTQ